LELEVVLLPTIKQDCRYKRNNQENQR
jgi:hypothetical protein